MFEKLGPEEWKFIIGWGLTIVGSICTLLLGIAGATLKFIIDIAKNTAALTAQFELSRNDNENEHREIHDRIGNVEADVKTLSAASATHTEQINGLINRRGQCST